MVNAKLTNNYYNMAQDIRCQHLDNISDYDFGDYDYCELWTGNKIDPVFPRDVKIIIDGEGANDFLGCPFSWLIISKKLWKCISPMVSQHVQLINDIPLFKVGIKSKCDNYVLVNPLVQYSNKVKTNMAKFDFVGEKTMLPKHHGGVHLFTHEKHAGMYFITNELAQSIYNKGLIGIVLLPCEPIEK